MTIRLLRQRPGQDTQQSLMLKHNQMQADINEAKDLKWLTKIIENAGSKEDFIKKASLYVVFQMYKMKSA